MNGPPSSGQLWIRGMSPMAPRFESTGPEETDFGSERSAVQGACARPRGLLQAFAGSALMRTILFTGSRESRKRKRARSRVPKRFETAGKREPLTFSIQKRRGFGKIRSPLDLRHFQMRIDFLAHSHEMAVALEVEKGFPQASVAHSRSASYNGGNGTHPSRRYSFPGVSRVRASKAPTPRRTFCRAPVA